MENTFVVHADSGECVIIDPGCYEPIEQEELAAYIEDQNLKVIGLVNTHCHIDHAAEVSIVQNYFKVPFYIHRGDFSLLETLEDQGNFFDLKVKDPPVVSDYVNDGDILEFGNIKGTVLHTPGHSPGGISIKIDKNVFVGDCLFFDSIGRTDLPGGDYNQLLLSIQSKLLVMDDETVVYSGHGPSTTIGRERTNNPFLQG